MSFTEQDAAEAVKKIEWSAHPYNGEEGVYEVKAVLEHGGTRRVVTKILNTKVNPRRKNEGLFSQQTELLFGVLAKCNHDFEPWALDSARTMYSRCKRCGAVSRQEMAMC